MTISKIFISELSNKYFLNTKRYSSRLYSLTINNNWNKRVNINIISSCTSVQNNFYYVPNRTSAFAFLILFYKHPAPMGQKALIFELTLI